MGKPLTERNRTVTECAQPVAFRFRPAAAQPAQTHLGITSAVWP